MREEKRRESLEALIRQDRVQLDFNSIWTKKFHMYKLYLEKADELEIKLPTSTGSYKKQEKSRNISTSASLTMQKSFTVDNSKLWKIFKEIRIPDHLISLLWNLYEVKKQQLELDMEQQTGSNWERSTSRLYIVILLI